VNKAEFAKIAAYLSAGIGKKMPSESMDVWYDLLQDLPAELVLMAVKKVLVTYEYATIPPVGVIRKAAAELATSSLPSGLEAWNEAINAIRYFGQYRMAEGLESLSPPVRETVELLGWRDMCLVDKTEVIRSQFLKAWDAVAKREMDRAGLPAPVQEWIKAREPKRLKLAGGDDKYKDIYAI
jgi:hypothetical protein